MTKTLVTKNENETMLVGEELAKEFLELELDRSIVIFLQGELGLAKQPLLKEYSKV